jgi:hypothetical protein
MGIETSAAISWLLPLLLLIHLTQRLPLMQILLLPQLQLNHHRRHHRRILKQLLPLRYPLLLPLLPRNHSRRHHRHRPRKHVVEPMSSLGLLDPTPTELLKL